MWYVVQVKTGSEESALSMIKRLVDESCLDEAFSLQYETMIKFRGSWQMRKKALFPGYIIVVSHNIEELHRQLWNVPTFTKVLGSDEGFIPLSEEDIEWISTFTTNDNRTIGMSEGIIEGDKIVILKGPLMNHTGWIESINRRKRLAFLKIDMFGRTITTKVGLGIVKKLP